MVTHVYPFPLSLKITIDHDQPRGSFKTITFILKRISHCIGRFVARQLIAEVLQLLQLLPDVLHRILQVVVVAARASRARRGLLGEALPLLHHHHIGVGFTGGGGVVGLKFCCAL